MELPFTCTWFVMYVIQAMQRLGRLQGNRSTFISQNILYDPDLVHSLPQCLRVWEVRVSSGNSAHRSSQNLAIWASQHMLFDPTKTFCFFYIYFIAKVLCCFSIRTEEIQLMALRNIQVSKALVVAVKRSQSQIWDLKFAYAWQLIKYFCGLLQEAVSETRMAC